MLSIIPHIQYYIQSNLPWHQRISSIWEIRKSHLLHNLRRHAASLPCGHNICQASLVTEMKNVGSPVLLNAPDCQAEHLLLMSSTIWSFPNNLARSSSAFPSTTKLPSSWKGLEEIPQFHLEKTATCSLCGSGNEVHNICRTSELNFSRKHHFLFPEEPWLSVKNLLKFLLNALDTHTLFYGIRQRTWSVCGGEEFEASQMGSSLLTSMQCVRSVWGRVTVSSAWRGLLSRSLAEKGWSCQN